MRSVSNDRGSVHRDYQFAGHFESSQGNRARGRELYDVLESYVRKGFFALDKKERQDGRDIMWYLSGCTPDSPLFGKNKMATFERYFLAEKETHVEKKNPYYALLENEEAIEKEKDIHSEIMVVKRVMDRILVGDTDVGRITGTGGRPGETACGISQR